VSLRFGLIICNRFQRFWKEYQCYTFIAEWCFFSSVFGWSVVKKDSFSEPIWFKNNIVFYFLFLLLIPKVSPYFTLYIRCFQFSKSKEKFASHKVLNCLVENREWFCNSSKEYCPRNCLFSLQQQQPSLIPLSGVGYMNQTTP